MNVGSYVAGDPLAIYFDYQRGMAVFLHKGKEVSRLSRQVQDISGERLHYMVGARITTK